MLSYLPLFLKDNNSIVRTLPLEEDFHLSKGLFQSGSVEYVFNVSQTREIVINILSEKPINFRLYNYETGDTRIERKWKIMVYEYPILKRETVWVVHIETSNSQADGIITITSQVPSFPSKYVHMSASRDVGGSEITMDYEDELEETISVHLSIKYQDLSEVWNLTVNGEERNKFTVTWPYASKYQHYVVEIVTNHEVFGGLSYRILTYGQF